MLGQVINDLRYAAENQKMLNGGESLFMTQEAAQALLVHVYMWREDYPAAIKQLRKLLIAESILWKIFQIGTKYSPLVAQTKLFLSWLQLNSN